MNKIKRHKYAWMAFLIPFFVMLFIMIVTKSAPFGDNSFMIVDALHQYLPFFADYQEKLKNMDSFFYSWNGGLGYNFYSLWAYYLSSPLNIIVGIVPKLTMIAALNFIIVIKFALCSFCGFCYFTYREGKETFFHVVLGLAYCFSSYMTGYYWNVMWLEVMILLPIILIGMDRMLKQGRWKMYCFSLFAAMCGNYYMSFMVCIFLVLWFLCGNFTDRKDFFIKGLRFAGASLLAAAMAAIVLLPAYQGLMATSSAHLSFPEWEWYGKGIELFTTHLVGMEPYNMSVEDGLGNLYCGILPLLLAGLYLCNRRIPWKDKIRKVLLVLFLAVSFQMEKLNYIWHGFHNQYGIPNRFAFIYLFVLLILAYEQLHSMEEYPFRRRYITLMTLLFIGIVGILYQSGDMEFSVPYLLSSVLFLSYGALLLVGNRKAKTALCILALVEITCNAIYGFDCSGQTDAGYYFAETKEIEAIKEKNQPAIGSRMELLKSKMLDESIWHTLPNATMFGSTALGDTVDAMDQLGFYTGVNEYLYEGGTPVTDMLLGMKSILVRNGNQMYRTGYEYIYSEDKVSLFENSFPTAIGYWMDEKIRNWDYQEEDPFQVQNEMVREAYGISKVFKEVKVQSPITKDCVMTGYPNGSYFTETETQREDNVTFIFNIEETQDLYLHFDGSNIDNTVIAVNGRQQQSGRLNSQVVSIGNVEAGDTVAVRLRLKDGEENSATIRMRAAKLDKEAFGRLKRAMKKNRFEMISYKSDEVKGRIRAREDGRVFFSIPYDRGWTVLVDGKKVQKTSFAKGFLAVDVKKGEHVMTLSYTPPGFSLGWKLSLLGWVIYIAIYVYQRRQKIF